MEINVVKRAEQNAQSEIRKLEGTYIKSLTVTGHRTDAKYVQHDFNETLSNLALMLECGSVKICRDCSSCKYFQPYNERYQREGFDGICQCHGIDVGEDDYCSFREDK